MINGNLELGQIKSALKQALINADGIERDETKSDAFLIGYLQGTINGLINYIKELEDND